MSAMMSGGRTSAIIFSLLSALPAGLVSSASAWMSPQRADIVWQKVAPQGEIIVDPCDKTPRPKDCDVQK